MPIEITIFSLIILLFSVVIHELSHGTVAYALGDQTAKDAGRLTLNPIPHLDIFGSIVFPLMMAIPMLFGAPAIIFGWAKPVPINPNNFKDPRLDSIKVALAGPVSNIAIAIFFGLLIRFIPLPPSLIQFFIIIVVLNLLLAAFNLLPIPPLDGSHLFFSLVPGRQEWKILLHQYGFFILIIFIFFLGGGRLIFSIVSILYTIITGQSLTF